jgi:GTP pyrophosphokinase
MVLAGIASWVSIMKTIAGQIRHNLLIAIDEFKAGDRILINQALALAEDVHQGELRRPTKHPVAPYIVHPMRVALIIIQELKMQEKEIVAAALLHDVVEGSQRRVGVGQIEQSFGRNIALMVSILTKPPENPDVPKEQQLYFYYERIKGANANTRLIKLADRLDNVREAIDSFDTKFQQAYLKETREIFLPLAAETNQQLSDELVKACDQLERAQHQQMETIP